MSKLLSYAVAAAVALPILATTTIAEGDTAPISGVWLTELQSVITIKPCASGHCGYISKFVVPPEIYRKNKEEIDRVGAANLNDLNNKDPDLRKRPIKGLQILTLLEQESDFRYRGEVYNPEDGNTYTGYVELVDQDTIRLTGCGFFDLVCRTESWSRAPR